MATHMKNAQELLFGAAGLRVSNFKMFPGNSREASAEKVAGELVAVLGRLNAGEFEVVADINE